MRTPFMVAAVLLAGVARAQTPPAAEPPQTPPAAEAAAPAPKPQTFGLIGDVAYEPGVGLRFKAPRTTVVLYGILEPTLSTVDNANARGDRQTGYQVSWFSGNRWGITGAQSLVADDSLKAIFRLESEYELPTGNMDTPNVLFNRDAWVGFESELGKITFGRQNSLGRDFSQNYGDPYGSPDVKLEEGGWTNTNNFKQLIFFAGSVTGTRMDNGVVWKRRFGSHVVAGLGYQFGGVAGAFNQNTTGSVGLAINYKPVNVSGFFTEANNHGWNQHAFAIGGNYQISVLRLNAGFFHYEALQGSLPSRTDNAFTVSAKVSPIAGGFELDLGYERFRVVNAAYNGAGNVINPFADASAATSVGTGSKGTLYGSIIYHFNRATQAYVAFDWMKLADGYRTKGAVAGALGAGRPSDDQTEIAVGTRLIF